MKKVLSITFALFFMTVVVSSAATSSADGRLELTVDTASGDAAFSVGLSPEVAMFHESNGTSPTSSQWYAISAGHPGGDRCYGTAQDVNNVYYREYSTAAELSTYLQSIPEDDTASSTWSSDWDL